MQTAQIISLAFALAGYVVAAPAPAGTGTAYAPSTTGTSSGSGAGRGDGPLVKGTRNLHYCSDPSNYGFMVNSVDISPKIPMPGSNVTISIKGDLKSDITAGTTRKNTIGQIVDGKEQILNTMSIDVCNSLKLVPDRFQTEFDVKQCPIASGPWEQTHSFEIPKIDMGRLPKMPKIDPSKLKNAAERIEAIYEQMEKDMPNGEFFFRGELLGANGDVLNCVYADMNTAQMGNMTALQ